MPSEFVLLSARRTYRISDSATDHQAPGGSLILHVENPGFRLQIRYVLALKSAISDSYLTLCGGSNFR